MLEKKPISYWLEFKGIKTNNLINGKGKNYHIANSIDASSNVEDDFNQRSMMIGHTTHAFVVIKGDVAIAKHPLEIDNGSIFTKEE